MSRREIGMAIGLTLSDPRLVVTEARQAEAAGFDLVAVGEHVFHHGGAPNPYVQLAAAAAATTRIRLLSSVSLLPLYPAALAAKLAATLDLVSGGRFDLGVGAGGEYEAEFAAVGVDPVTRFRKLDESLDVLQRLFTGERVSYDGEYTVLDDVALDPPPVQDGGPPIWLGGRGDGALRRAGRFAQVWMPYMVTPDRLAEGLVTARRQAEEVGRDPASIRGALFAFVCVDDDAVWARQTGTATVSRTYQQDFAPLAAQYLLLGSSDDVCSRIAEFTGAGAETIVLQVAATGPVDRRRVMQTLISEVLPKVAAS
ncbi:LLM class flavin-dependent oxidoreductase [Mumia sp. Pv 4-285]|uniref:LLM class flavin-dependent oxidoreductase n=1 Tax=Mumia qirimensis TaxID=3234852 RepID=UPI00351D0DDF